MMGCGQKAAEETKAPVSDGSEDLMIDFQVNLAQEDEANHFNWKGNIRYMAAEDTYDAVSGASALGSTHLFMTYLYDVEAKPTMSTGVRGLFLFGVNPFSQVGKDNLNASKAEDGTITIQYIHRGTAYRFITDKEGVLSFPAGKFQSRKVGSTKNEIEAPFSSDGTVNGVDWAQIWGSESDIQWAGGSREAMYLWYGPLTVTLDGSVLALKGTLTAVAQ